MNMRTLLLLFLALPAIAQQGTVTVTVDKASTTIQIVVPVQVSSVTCPATITPASAGGSPAICTATLTQPAPAGGFRVNVYTAVCKNADQSPCTQQPTLNPTMLTVAAGSSTWSFAVSLP